eukprot:TRINITY_DN106305_c0_g1_i1.p1 TRINITY_DN106305_c0_g1~~TRINITY_DN106305_c0_g1_i1.p1  ORF type:complete len:274 (+),score=75.09 TRINITY_DN106305_c0_g1_i1:93-914(+)
MAETSVADLAALLDDDEYNEKIFALVADITETSGAWDEFSRQITEDMATRLKEKMELPTWKLEIKELFEAADQEKAGFVSYGKKSFQEFVGLCIKRFGLPTPKGGELPLRKLFNRFRSDQKLDLSECETLATTMGHVIVRAFGLTVASASVKEMTKQIKESGAWAEFQKALKDKGFSMVNVQDITEKLQGGDLKQMFDDEDKTNAGELSWARGEALPFMKAALGAFGFPEPAGGEMVYFKMFKGFAKMSGKSITYPECIRMIATSLIVALSDA